MSVDWIQLLDSAVSFESLTLAFDQFISADREASAVTRRSHQIAGEFPLEVFENKSHSFYHSLSYRQSYSINQGQGRHLIKLLSDEDLIFDRSLIGFGSKVAVPNYSRNFLKT